VGILKYLKPFDHVEVAVWEITEQSESAFSFFQTGEAFKSRLAEIANPKRRIEYLASRAALNHIYPESTVYYEGKKPMLTDGTHVSFSHNRQYGAAARAMKHPVGIDLEFGRPGKIEAISQKFLSDSEQQYFQNPTARQLAWGAKEALFKCYGKGRVDFRNDLILSPFKLSTTGYFSAWIRKEDTIPCEVFYHIWGNHYLVLALANLEEKK
jgi:4'-phosphopantetheinyl transferase